MRVMHVNEMQGGYKNIRGLGFLSQFPDYVSLTPRSDSAIQQLSDNADLLASQYNRVLANDPMLAPGLSNYLLSVPPIAWIAIAGGAILLMVMGQRRR